LRFKLRLKPGVEAIAEATGENLGVAERIHRALPIAGRVEWWGEELYFYIPLETSVESGREVVEVGDVAYWPEGPAICVFLGPTPASRGDEVRAYSEVAVFAKVVEGLEHLRQARRGDEITLC